MTICTKCGKDSKGRKKCSTCRCKETRYNNELRYVYLTTLHNAKRRNIPFLMSIEDFKILCEVTGYLHKRGIGAEDATLEREENDIGYVMGNVSVIPKSENSRREQRRRKDCKGWYGVKGLERQATDPF